MSVRSTLSVLSLLVALTGCGGGGGGEGSSNGPPPPAVPPPPAPPPSTPAPLADVVFLYRFRNDALAGGGGGTQPNGPLLQASDGNFYGTTLSGGKLACPPDESRYCGVIFKMTPAGEKSVVYSFGSIPNDGFAASGRLIQGKDGALYGVTALGGEYGGGGTVFRITLNGEYTVLHSFGAPDEGYVPFGGLTEASDGDFYGVTTNGGANHCFQIPVAGGNCGTIFRMTPEGVVTTLHSFGGSITDGVEPMHPPIEASDGNFYGTTITGGANNCGRSGGINNCGTVYRMTPGGEVTYLHSFGSSTQDGIAPMGDLIQAGDGALYGTTSSGGGGECLSTNGCGTIFRMTLAGEVSTVHAFALTSVLQGFGPSPNLTLGTDGNIYGSTVSGGDGPRGSQGTVFRITLDGSKATLYSFGEANVEPGHPEGGVIQGSDGAFYGTTLYDGVFPSGTIFKLTLR